MRVGLKMIREGRAAGFVTAGNTGAAMATAKMVLGSLSGVDRPCAWRPACRRPPATPACCSTSAQTSTPTLKIWCSSR